jgi:tetratricopeptide (TPR) repeat protein
MSIDFSADGGRDGRSAVWPGPGAALAAVLVLLLIAGFAGSACGKKKADPYEPSAVENAITEYQQGAMLLEQGSVEEAILSFRRALEYDEDNVLCHYSLALAYFRVGRYGEAMSEADKALSLNPEYIECYNIKGMIYNEQGQYLKAMESFRRLLEAPSYGKPWIAHYNLGFAAANAGNMEEALFYYSRALEEKDDYVQARYQRGLMLERLGREEEALQEYLKVRDALPENADIHFSIGRLYFRAGNAVEARMAFEWVMRYAPGTEYSTQSATYLNMMEQAGR